MQAMDVEEREEFVLEQAEKRDTLKAEIQELDRDRRAFIRKERESLAQSASAGLDIVIQEGLKSQAEEKGFTFEDD